MVNLYFFAVSSKILQNKAHSLVGKYTPLVVVALDVAFQIMVEV